MGCTEGDKKMKKYYTFDFDFTEADFVGDNTISKRERFNYWSSKHYELTDALQNKEYYLVYMIVDLLLFYVDIDFCNTEKINEIQTKLKVLKSIY